MEIPIPLIKAPIGAGDVVAAVTETVKIKPCGGCKKRREQLNQAVIFTPIPPKP